MKYKSKINFMIDVIMFVVMMVIGGIGFLMKFVLVSGSKSWEIYGEKVDLFLWGWDRHQWGSLHLILGYLLLGLLVLHIVFHRLRFRDSPCLPSTHELLVLLFRAFDVISNQRLRLFG